MVCFPRQVKEGERDGACGRYGKEENFFAES